MNRTTSCGCRQKETGRLIGSRSYPTHNASKTPEYNTWRQLRQRCQNPHNPAWRNYGGRGIMVCERWASFENFIADMGLKPGAEYSIDRVNNDANYEPSNCR